MKKFLFCLLFVASYDVAIASPIFKLVKNETILHPGYEKCVYLLSKFGDTYDVTLSTECTLSFGVTSAFYEICKHKNSASFSLSVKHDKTEFSPEKFSTEICKELRETSRKKSERLYRLQVYSGVRQARTRYRCGNLMSSSARGNRYYYEFVGSSSSRAVALSRARKLHECGIESWLRPDEMLLE